MDISTIIDVFKLAFCCVGLSLMIMACVLVTLMAINENKARKQMGKEYDDD